MKHRSGSDIIVLGLVGVVALVVIGVVTVIVIEALDPNQQSEIGQSVSTLLATIGGACVGVAGGYVSHSKPSMPWEGRDETPVVVADVPTDAAPAPSEDAPSSDTALVAEPVDQEPVEVHVYEDDESQAEDVTDSFREV